MDKSSFIHFMVAMIAITNPFGNMAIFLGLVGNRSRAVLRSNAIIMGIAITIILLMMTWAGTTVLGAFGISVPVFEIAGGLVILLLGLGMLNPQYAEKAHPKKELEQDKEKLHIAVVPMAIPIVAGPGAITTLIIFTHHNDSFADKTMISLGVILLAFCITVIFYFSNYIKRLLGDRGIKITVRVMGLVLAAIATGMILSGLKEVFPILASGNYSLPRV